MILSVLSERLNETIPPLPSYFLFHTPEMAEPRIKEHGEAAEMMMTEPRKFVSL